MHRILLFCWPSTILIWLTTAQTDHTKKTENFEKPEGLHLPLFRRSGRFSHHEPFNATYMAGILSLTEQKYRRTTTLARDNRIVRQWRDGPNGADTYLLDGSGLEGNWYTVMQIGSPPQRIEVDIDMLSPDFYFITTSSGKGVGYDVFNSTSKVSTNEYAHPLCPIFSELLSTPQNSPAETIRLDIPICQPARSSLQTLSNSGAILGLAPFDTSSSSSSSSSSSLSRLSTPNLLTQLLHQSLISHPLLSLTLLDSTSGILSLGGSIAPAIEHAKIRAEKELLYLGTVHTATQRQKMEDEIGGAMAFAIPPGSTHEHHFKWTDVGAGAVAGWHMTLVSGVWVNGVKVLRNQPVLFDVNCPFILAPAGAAAAVYQAVPGGRILRSVLLDDEKHKGKVRDNAFYAFPCLNDVDLAFEVAGWKFAFGRSEVREDTVHGPFGGRFSLGQVDLGGGNNGTGSESLSTGYCVGVVVATGMGDTSEASRSAMRDVWVLGEPFFRGMGVAFDMGRKKGKTRVGVRVY